ncbi:hypothetical protein [Actibacterium ureilyticum]|uniref:hypothetical protein n=1 Tax=Actibacterium ureilyticum TaxID=1590614 RepID=UPI000BAADFB7|nr:hypothetical protein [Actibacterium ureilyticum]
MNRSVLFTALGASVFLVTGIVLTIQRFQTPDPAPATPVAQGISPATGAVDLPQAPLVPRVASRTVTAPAAPGDGAALQPGRYSPYGLPCDVALSARLALAAQVVLSLQANCALSQPLIVEHAGLRFSGRTDARGHYRVMVPALNDDALFQISFADGASVQVHVAVPDAPLYRRVVLQWQGDQGVSLHAREFGAGYGGTGHVWTAQPGRAEDAVAHRGGYLSQLGDADAADGWRAQVYSLARGLDRGPGVVRVSVEAEVTRQNCGRMAVAETLQPGADGLLAAGLRVQMPDCSAVGEFLVLKNVLRDLKIARN